MIASACFRAGMTYVNHDTNLTYMEKTQVYLRKEELAALVRDVIRKVVLKPHAGGPVAIWDGKPKRVSLDHDSVHDEP